MKPIILLIVCSSIHPFLQIILVLNLCCGMELNEFRPPNSSDDLCALSSVCFFFFALSLWFRQKPYFFPSISRISPNEYVSVIEGTAPPCVFKTFAHPTSPCSVCSILQLPDCLTEQAGRGWVGKCLEDTGGVLSVLLLIYSLVGVPRQSVGYFSQHAIYVMKDCC